jgi:transposase-like protein
MKEQSLAPTYKRHRFPPELIAHTVWRYFLFALRYRDVEELLAEGGVIVTYETVRQWRRTFGQGYANALRRRRPRPGDKWHLDGTIASPPFGAPHHRTGGRSGSRPRADRRSRDQ